MKNLGIFLIIIVMSNYAGYQQGVNVSLKDVVKSQQETLTSQNTTQNETLVQLPTTPPDLEGLQD